MIFVQDSFTDIDGTLLEDHTPDIGGTWTARLFTMSITGNKLNSAVGAIYDNTTVAPFDNIDITFRWLALGNYIGAVGRSITNNANNQYRAVYDSDRYILQRVLNGVVTNLVYLIEATPTLPALFTFELRTFGPNRLRLLINNVEKLVSSDTTFTQPGKIGIIGAGTGILDDFVGISSSEGVVQQNLHIYRQSGMILAI